MMKKFIFDLDGLLVNTERMAFGLWQETAEKFCIDFDMDWAITLMGRNCTDAKKEYIRVFGEENRAMEIRNYRRALLIDKLKKEGTQPMPGAVELLKHLKANGYEIAMATGSSKDKVKIIFESVDIKDYFDVIITGDMVLHGKPDPEEFLLAIEKLNTKPNNTIIIEDSPLGVEAAHRIGATVIWIPDLYPRLGEVSEKCNYVFNSLFEVLDNLEVITAE